MIRTLPQGCVEACPGCRHRGRTRDESLQQKARWLAERLAPWRSVLQPVVSAPEPQRWHYRDRGQLACGWDQAAGRWMFGLTRRDELIPIHQCPVQSHRLNGLIALLSRTLPPPEGNFQLRWLVQSGAQVTLVLKQKTTPPLSWLDDAFCAALEALGIEGFWLHRNPATGRKVLAKRDWDLIWGRPRSRDKRGLSYGPAAFAQLLPDLHKQALEEAEAFLAPGQATAVVDLYCGNGSSLVRWLRRGADALGVESAAEAVECARENAAEAVECARENAAGAMLLQGSCLHRLPQIDAWLDTRGAARRLLYTNPPRTGMEPEVTEWIVSRMRPERIACLSCSAGTLARDLTLLCDAGYRVERLSPWDFFPHTHHVETLALLSRAC